jgi:hypothetical protein
LNTATAIVLVVAVVFLVLYMMRRKSRLDREAGGEN